MRNLLAGLSVALFLGACAGGVVPGIMLATVAPSPGLEAALTDARRPSTDTERDALRHPSDILAFTGVQQGWRVADVGPGGGYYTRLFSVAVGETGRVFAIDRPNTPERTRPILAVAPAYPNVTVVQQGYQGWSTGEPLDAIFISQIYHDFHLTQAAVDVPRLNRDMFAALKPGGVLVIIDHAAVDGAPTSTDGATATHRIDRAQVVRELEAAGFVLEEESEVLRNPADNRTVRVFEGDIRGHTDQFALRFREAGLILALLPHNPNAFTRSPLDRASHLRKDEAWLKAATEDNEQTLLLVFNKGRPFLYESGGGLFVRWLAPHVYAALGDKELPLIFLGVDGAGSNYFACEIADPSALGDLGAFEEMRPAAPRLEADKVPIIGTACAILNWHGRNKFCANCATPTRVIEAGWVRKCGACNAEHYPRLDPVCIMVPTFGDRCFLGRQKMWPRGMHSALAGFIEPGEAIEEAVARETLEEAGLKVREVTMHSTQPWPFPHSLMIGVLCEVEDDKETVDTTELESGRWFTREEAKLLIAGKHPECWAPPPFAIAHQLLKTWSEQ